MADYGREMKSQGSIYFGDFPSRVIQPRIVVTNLMMSSNPASAGNSELTYASEIGAVHAPEYFVPHNNVIPSDANFDYTTVKNRNDHLLAGVPTVGWKTWSFSGGTPYLFNYPNNSGFGHQVIDVKCKEAASQKDFRFSAKTPTTNEWQGVRLAYSRTYADTQSSTGSEDWFVISFQIGVAVYRIYHSSSMGTSLDIQTADDLTNGGVASTNEYGDPVWATSGRQPKIAGDWVTLIPNLVSKGEMLRVGGSQSRTQGSDHIEVLIKSIGNHLSIFVTGMNQAVSIPFYMNRHLTTLPIKWLSIDVKNMTSCSFSAHPMKFLANSFYRSYPQQLGFFPSATTPIRYRVWYPDGFGAIQLSGETQYGVTVTTVVGTDTTSSPVYDVDLTLGVSGTWKEQDYADSTPLITKVDLMMDGIESNQWFTPTHIDFPASAVETYPPPQETVRFKGMVEKWTVDMERLSFNHTVDVAFSIFGGIDEFTAYTGVRPLGTIIMAMDNGYTHLGQIPKFTGMVKRYSIDRPSGGATATLTLHGISRMRQLEDRIIHAPPNLDLHNHYAAMYYLASYAGFTDADIGWMDYVDTSDPTNFTVLDTEPYALPTDFGNRTWTPMNNSVNVRQLMWEIQKLTGFFLWADHYGRLQYRAWVPLTTPTPKRTFAPAYVPEYDDGIPTEYSSYSLELSNEDTRNRMILMGVDQYSQDWSAVTVKLEDEASISASVGQQPINYIGYPVDFVLEDTRFANKAFAVSSASRIFNIIRQPQTDITLNCAWRHDDINPFDCIRVEDDKVSWLRDFPFYVLGVVHVTELRGSTMVQASTLHAKYLETSGYFEPTVT